MKKKLIISVILGILTAAFAFRSSAPAEKQNFNISETGSAGNNTMMPPAGSNISSNYLIGAMDCGADITYNDINDLGLNVWHKYVYAETDQNIQLQIWGWNYTTDLMDADINVYGQDVRDIISENNNNGLRTLMERPKTTRLAFGQRSDYQCESKEKVLQVNPDLWFYAFNNNDVTGINGGDWQDNSVYGSNQWVRRCITDPNNAPSGQGFAVRRLITNSEQCNMNSPIGPVPGDKIHSWYIKPSIRADKNFIDNHSQEPVCRVDIYNLDGNLIKSTEIRARNFKDLNGLYDGYYHEEFNFDGPSGDSTLIFPKQQAINFNPNNGGWAFNSRGVSSTDGSNKMDIRVYWYGTCDMWIDYVRVDNDVAHDLLSNDPLNLNWVQYDNWLHWEAQQIATHTSSPLKFYIEEFEFNHIPCMSYVSRKLRDYSLNPNFSLMSMVNLQQYNLHLPYEYVSNNKVSAEHIATYLIDRVGESQVLSEPYALTGFVPGTNYNDSKVPETLPLSNYRPAEGRLGEPKPVNEYEEWLQEHLDDNGMNIFTKKGLFSWYIKTMDSLTRLRDISYINMPQTHLWYMAGEEALREPTNEELEMTTLLPVTYGAKGTLYFWYGGWGCMGQGTSYGRGLVEPVPCNTPNPFLQQQIPQNYVLNRRLTNAYGQPKWEKVKSINNKLSTWSPYLMSFDTDNRHSYIFRLENERIDCINETYFRDIVSYKTGTGEPPCSEDHPDTTDAPHPNGLRYECNEDRYLQVATFKRSTNDGNKYFMIVNRRCSPYVDESSEDNRGGRRFMRVYFDQNSNEFPLYNSWNIVDIENPYAIVGSFDKTALVPYVDLGWFEPGQGKLYQIVPVLPKGGTLVADEVIYGESFTCEAPVYNNGFNITIGANTTIHFNDSSKFVMSGGVFTVGDQNTSAPQNITSDAVPGGSWRGHSFTNCEVKIYGATFAGLANDTTYAVNIIDCPVVDIRNCTFNTNSSLKGGVNAICFDNPFIAINNIYIGSNTFNSSGSTIPTVNVSSYAGVTTPLIIENNTFNEGNTAVFLSGVIGGAIKGNTITDNYIGINALTSSIDVVQNTITSTVNGSMGIFAAGGSELKLNNSGAFTLGGLNTISNEGTGTNNINVDGSYFLLEGGENIFNISSDQSSYHLYGYFPMFTAVTTEETNNCFKVDDSPVDPPINMVTSGYQGTQITFNFNPYLTGCEIPDGGDGLAIDFGDGIYDTIYTGGSGSGGSMKEALPLRKSKNRSLGGEYPQGEGVYYKQTTPSGYAGHPSLLRRGAYTPQLVKEKYDSVCVLMRYRNYTQAKTKCLDLINTYPDSIQSIFAVSKLFLATVAGDTSYNAVNTLKIFYENLILNHPGNTSLVKRANYYILKCKVRMREYSQALAGFQQIINQNPYSYEGLIARWDYMATSLLAPQGGSFGSEPTVSVRDDDSRLSIDIVNALQNEADADDKNPFTKEQRQDIRKSINTAIEISKNDDEVKIKKLEEKSELGDVNASKELTQMKSLKQVVKTEKPKSIIEHVRIVSEDIRKVFGSNTSSKGNEPKNIPLVFRISQNYPNPFNPVTKINYDLPKDSKVKIVIYDILGREVKRLVNNELKTAGSYIVDFNASNYASGVYFYSIEAEEQNGNKFVDSKKMVLLK